jgi:hypothetical protein
VKKGSQYLRGNKKAPAEVMTAGAFLLLKKASLYKNVKFIDC